MHTAILRTYRPMRFRPCGIVGFVIVLLGVLAAMPTSAQMLRWSLPPYSISWSFDQMYYTALPSDLRPSTLNGTAAHTLVCDEEGGIRFYVADSAIYDGDGHTMGGFVAVNEEIAVIPIPGNPDAYYLVAVETGRFIKLWFPIFHCVKVDLADKTVTPIDPIVVPDDRIWAIEAKFAVSTERPNHKRDLFVMEENELWRFEVTANGFSEAIPVCSMYDEGFGGPGMVSEMELSEEPVDGFSAMRLALPYGRSDSSLRIRVVDLSDDYEVIYSRDIIVEIAASPWWYSVADVPGVEFSPNGRYLYVTSPEGLKCYDVLSDEPIQPMNISYASETLEYMHSQIEIGPDCNLYLAGPTGLARIEDPNNAPGIWKSNVLAIPDLKPSLVLDDGIAGVYTLPDQVDRRLCFTTGVEVTGGQLLSGRIYMEQPRPSTGNGKFVFGVIPPIGCHRMTLRVMGISGACISTQQLEVESSGRCSLNLDLSAHPNGTYFINIAAGGTSATRVVQVVR